MDLAQDRPEAEIEGEAEAEAEERPATAARQRAVPIRREVQQLRTEIARMQEDASSRAVMEELGAFIDSRPEGEDLPAEFAPTLAKHSQEYHLFLRSGDPAIVRHTARLVLETAYLDAKAQKAREKKAQAVERRSAQRGIVTDLKKEAAGAPGAMSAPGPPPKRTYAEMTREELRTLLDREHPRT